jgi:MerR family transcriptional regulator, thiopeptide resistance regulator
MTVTQLARACGLSRSTVLYYESLGLIQPSGRSPGNYRVYNNRDLLRLRQVCLYRDAGLKLADIRGILDQPAGSAAAILERRLAEIEVEIGRMREHQRTIVQLLKDTGKFRRLRMVTKQKWTEIMRAAGFTDADMHRWHAEFEKSAPAEHQEFLEFLHIPAGEVARIRAWSRDRNTTS